MIRRALMIAVVTVLLVLCGWDLAWWALGVSPMFPWTLKNNLAEKHVDLLLVDVRSLEDYGRCHIRGAKHRPDLVTHPDRLGREYVQSPVVVICATGHRSVKVVYGLNKLGFKRVFNLTGGMLAWRLVNGPVVGGD